MSNIPPNRICEDSARECVRLARMTDDLEMRNELFKMARDWMAVAMKEEQAANGPIPEAA
jgi:hypothetical protein